MPPHAQVNGGVFTNGGTNMFMDENGNAFQYNGVDGTYMELTTSMDDPCNVRVFNGNGGGVHVSTFTDGSGRIVTQCRTNGNNNSTSQNFHTTNPVFAQPELQRAFEEGVQERQREVRDQQRGAQDHRNAARDLQRAARDQERAARDRQRAARDQQRAARDQQHAARDLQRAARDEHSAEDPWNSWPLNQGPRPPPWMTGGDPATFWQGAKGPSSHSPPLASSTGARGDVREQDWMSDDSSDDSDDEDFRFHGRRGAIRETKMDKMRRKMAEMEARAARLEVRVGPAPGRDGGAPPASHANGAAYTVRSEVNVPACASTAHHAHAHVEMHSAPAHVSSATQANSGTSGAAAKKKVPRSMIEKLRSMGPSILEGFRGGESS